MLSSWVYPTLIKSCCDKEEKEQDDAYHAFEDDEVRNDEGAGSFWENLDRATK